MSAELKIEYVTYIELKRMLNSVGVNYTPQWMREIARLGYFPEPVHGKYLKRETLLGLVEYNKDLSERRCNGR